MKKSFTLIELLVVVFIIGLLASLVVVNVNRARSRARDAKRKSDLSAIASALHAYYTENHSYPTTGGTWCGEPGSGYSGCFGGTSYSGSNGYVPDIAPTYINVLPADPARNAAGTCSASNRAYLYRSDGTHFKLLAHCTPETGYETVDPFYDPIRTTWAWQISSDGTSLNW